METKSDRFSLLRIANEFHERARLHGIKYGLDDEFWNLVVRATTAEFDAKTYAMESICSHLDAWTELEAA